MDQSRYSTAVVSKYLDNSTIKENSKFHETKLTHYIIFTKQYASTSDEQAELLSGDYNIHYRYFMGSLIYLLSTIVYLCFSVHNLELFSSNPGKVHFEGLIHLLRDIRDNKNLGLKYYSKIEGAPLSDLLIHASINTDIQLMVLSDSICKNFPYNRIIMQEKIAFFKVELSMISHMLHIQLNNIVLQVSINKHALKEWIFHNSEC